MIEIAQAGEGCLKTELKITGDNEIPAALVEYTDGYKGKYALTLNEEGIFFQEFHAPCWGYAEDK